MLSSGTTVTQQTTVTLNLQYYNKLQYPQKSLTIVCPSKEYMLIPIIMIVPVKFVLAGRSLHCDGCRIVYCMITSVPIMKNTEETCRKRKFVELDELVK